MDRNLPTKTSRARESDMCSVLLVKKKSWPYINDRAFDTGVGFPGSGAVRHMLLR